MESVNEKHTAKLTISHITTEDGDVQIIHKFGNKLQDGLNSKNAHNMSAIASGINANLEILIIIER